MEQKFDVPECVVTVS